MEILGSRFGGGLIIDGEVILPAGSDRFEIPLSKISGLEVADLMDNPTTKYLCYVTPEGNRRGMACLTEISYIRLNDKTIEVNMSGLARVMITDTVEREGRPYAMDIRPIEKTSGNPERLYEMAAEIIAIFAEHAEGSADAEMVVMELASIQDMSDFADFMLFNILDDEEKLSYALRNTSTTARMREVHMALKPEEYEPKSDPSKLKSNNEDVKPLIARYYEIKPLLGERADKEIFDALKSLAKMGTSNSDYNSFFRFCDMAVNLPFDKETEDAKISDVEKEVKKSHYGMDKAKERIMEYLAIKALNPDARGTVMLLDGPPGTGKTTLAISVAKAMGRKYARVSMGGCADASFIKGHGRTYVGAKAGRIMSEISSLGVKNPVIILDEVEKVTPGVQGDPSAALLELLDPGVNTSFTDTYLNFGFDLSKVLFICTSNNAGCMPEATRDRMEFIPIDGYLIDEKIKIATDYVIPAKAKEMGVKGTRLSKVVIKHIVEGYTREPGVRGLEKAIDNLLRKVAIDKSKGKVTKVTKKLVEKRLGLPIPPEVPLKHDRPGIVSGMYYNGYGGGVLDIEGIVTNEAGGGELKMTGLPGDVMEESIDLVYSYMIANSERLGLVEKDEEGNITRSLETIDIHVHMPEGSTPKNGPSAGGAFALLLASILSKRPVKDNLSLTGEATLTGRITAIGGLEEKCPAAIRCGIKTILLPKQNYRDFMKLPENVRKGADYKFVETIDEVIELGLK